MVKEKDKNLTSEKKYSNKGNYSKSKYLKDLKVLLVEDSIVNQKITLFFLKIHEVDVDIADNGKMALEKLIEKNYDIILMDINMPEMDGYTATKIIKTDEKYKSHSAVPIIALTGNSFKGDKTKAMELGIKAYLTKPINESDLVKTLERVINSSKK